jgi:hypothetical protein
MKLLSRVFLVKVSRTALLILVFNLVGSVVFAGENRKVACNSGSSSSVKSLHGDSKKPQQTDIKKVGRDR